MGGLLIENENDQDDRHEKKKVIVTTCASAAPKSFRSWTWQLKVFLQ